MDDLELLIQTADRTHHHTTGDHLSDLQIAVLQGSLQNQDYKTIARTTGKTIEHIRKIGSHLWKSLSQSLQEPITKANCRTVLQRARQTPNPTAQLIDWGEAPDIPVFFGRQTELTTLTGWILTDRCRFISIIGFRGIGKTAVTLKLGKGGIGKTDLTLKLAQGIQPHFEVIIWRSLLNAPHLTDHLTDRLPRGAAQEVSRDARRRRRPLAE
ncbi:MAG: hypothetical protein HC860_16460, partial [Alkalinema sp. RU_4_3]|nr:hypothetical protein [Alkalinema sp. RU_4_3]